MSIVPTDVPMTAALCDETIAKLLARYPSMRSRLLTGTAFGRPIRTLELGNGPRRVLYTAAHHANEWITAPVVLKFMEELAQAAEADGRIFDTDARSLLAEATVYAVPMVDPDGVDLVTGVLSPGQLQYEAAAVLSERYPNIPFPDGWKANLLGVDLNLQYPAGWRQAREIKFSQGFTRPGPRDFVGRAPLTQLEAQALARYTEEVDPALVLAFHSQGKVIYWQFNDIAVPGAREKGEEFARVSGYTLSDTPEESSYAGYKDWFIQQYRRPGYTIEVGEGINPLPLSQFDEIYDACLGILVTAAKA